MSFGGRVKEARLRLNLTQLQLANMIGVTKGAIGNYENGTSHPKEPILIKLMEALKVDANFLFQDLVSTTEKETLSNIEPYSKNEIMTFGERLAFLRKGRRFTQEQLAKLIGVAKSTVAGYELNKREPNLETIKKITSALDVTENYLLGTEEVSKVAASSLEEIELIETYRNLNQIGKAKALEFMEDMLVNPKYTNPADEMAASLEIGNLKEVKKLRESKFSSDIEEMRAIIDAQEAVDEFQGQESKKERLYS